MKNEFCCRAFNERRKLKGKRGFAVSRRENSSKGFVFISRGIDKDDESILIEVVKSYSFPVKINFSEEIGFKYCPWCGTDISQT